MYFMIHIQNSIIVNWDIFRHIQVSLRYIQSNSQAVAGRCSAKKNFLEISQILCKTFVPVSLLKKIPCYRCFPVNFAKFLRTPFLTKHLQWLLLQIAAYLEPCVTLAYSEPAIFRIPVYVEWKIHSELCQGISWHIQNVV